MLLSGLALITMVFYSLARLLFLLWNWSVYAPLSGADLGLSFLFGLRFDLFTVAWLCLPAFLLQLGFWFFRRRGSWAVTAVFALVQFVFLVPNLGDSEYVQFTGRRFTIEQVKVAAEIQGKFWATMLAAWELFSIGIVILTAFVVCCFLWRKWINSRQALPRRQEAVILFVLFLALGISARGGLQRKPIGFAHAQVFANPAMNHLTLNSGFTFLQSLRRQSLPREHWMSTADMLANVDGGTPGESLMTDALRPAGVQNVVIVIIESMSLEHMGKVNGDKGYTPFLDELADKSLFFPNAFANARRSIEGIGAVLGGVPALMSEPFISSQYASNEFFGLGTRLAPLGYSSVFYHGGHNGTMYFDHFAQSAGMQRYYGETEYGKPQDDDGTWGIWDEPFLLNMVQDLRQQKEPFAASVFTLTSHTPFKVPDAAKGLYPKGTSEIHEVVGYTDASLRKFFAAAAKESWYAHTLFVVTADHTYKPSRPLYKNDLGDYRIPILFFHPGIAKWPAVDIREPVQQIDILPSVLDFLGVKTQQENLLGRSVFRTGSRYVVLSADGFYWLVTRDHLLTQNARGDVDLLPLTPHLPGESMPPAQTRLNENPLLKDRLLKKLEATRQYFSEGLWDNKLYYPSGR